MKFASRMAVLLLLLPPILSANNSEPTPSPSLTTCEDLNASNYNLENTYFFKTSCYNLNGAVGATYSTLDKTLSKQFLGKIYLTSFISPRQQFFFANDLNILAKDGITKEAFKFKTTLISYRLGLPLKDKWQLSLAYRVPPFGINSHPLSTLYESVDPSFFWGTEIPQIIFTNDNLRNLTWELSLGKSCFGACNDQLPIVNLRILYDISALYGTRLTSSFKLEKKKVFSFGILNESQDKNFFHIEWIKQFEEGVGSPEQLIRLAFVSNFRNNQRTLAQYDDVLNRYRLFLIGQEYSFWNPLLVQINFGFKKFEGDSVGHTFLINVGLSAQR